MLSRYANAAVRTSRFFVVTPREVGRCLPLIHLCFSWQSLWNQSQWRFLSTTSQASDTQTSVSKISGTPPSKQRKPLTFPKIIILLRLYEEHHRDLLIPSLYVIPKDGKDGEFQWPKFSWGYPLGRDVVNLREKHRSNKLTKTKLRTLESIGFVWYPIKFRQERVLKAIEIFVSVFGHCNIPQQFVIPEDPAFWPRYMWNYHLGWSVAMIRAGQKFVGIRAKACELGLELRKRPRNGISFDDLKAALQAFYSEHGHYDVPIRFIVPPRAADGPKYPASMEGVHLGVLFSNVCKGLRFADRRAELEAMGVPLVNGLMKSFNCLLKALRGYRQWKKATDPKWIETAPFKMPLAFVVPADHKFFEPSLWGMQLGQRWSSLRRHNLFVNHHDVLIAEGFLDKAESEVIKRRMQLRQERQRRRHAERSKGGDGADEPPDLASIYSRQQRPGASLRAKSIPNADEQR